jgi:transcriptional regulator with XRE-family HTH domain
MFSPTELEEDVSVEVIPMKTEIRYGRRVKEERLKKGWTQEHLAEVADVTVRTVARIEKGEVQGLESLMAIAAAFDMELGKLGQVFRIAEAKPLRSLMIQRAEDLPIALNRAYHSGLYRPMLLPMRTDLQERAEELLETIFSDLQYLSPDEPEVVGSWVQSVKEPIEELHGMGMEIFSIQDCREGFIGEPGKKTLMENWTTGYYLLVLEHGCFSAKNYIHRFNEQCETAVNALHEWLRQERDGTKVDLYLFPNELMVTPVKTVEQSYCTVCFPNGPTGECMTQEYLRRITGLSSEEIHNLFDQLRTSLSKPGTDGTFLRSR